MPGRAQLWYSIADLSAMFDFGRSTVRMWWQQGRFGPVHESIKVGDDIRVPQSGVDFFILQNRVVRTPDQIEANRQEIARKLAAREQRLEREEPAPIVVPRPSYLRAAGLLSAPENGGEHG